MEFGKRIETLLTRFADDADRMVFLTDTVVYGLLTGDEGLQAYPWIVVESGEGSKSVEMLSYVWRRLEECGATRRSVLVCVGGGVVCDLGGFAAGTFKRGIRHVNVPTTLLAMADAAIGGKTGIDFNGLKNEVGMFRMPEEVVIVPEFLETLPEAEILNGMAEVVKSAMLGSAAVYEGFLSPEFHPCVASLREGVEFSAAFKQRVVDEDPQEKGIRRILNLGHTAGHAFESLMSERGCPVSHGEAVAHGLLVTLILSERLCGLAHDEVGRYARCILFRFYCPLMPDDSDTGRLLELMEADKKNLRHGELSFVLLEGIGLPVSRVAVDGETARWALRRYLEICREGW